jgi:Cu2+-exporting ATPase
LVHANKSITFLAVNHQLAGLLAISHDLRADAQSTIAILQKSGLNVMIMTGDQEVPAQAVANQLGLTNTQVLANVRPDEKAAVIARLQQAGERVGMVGDGINDGPALAQADVGIALHSGTDVAVESSQIVLMGNRLQDVVSAIWLSRSIFNKIRQNLFWAMTYNIIGIPIAAGVLLPSWGIVLNPATAGALMAFSSISVVVNSLTLRME